MSTLKLRPLHFFERQNLVTLTSQTNRDLKRVIVLTEYAVVNSRQGVVLEVRIGTTVEP